MAGAQLNGETGHKKDRSADGRRINETAGSIGIESPELFGFRRFTITASECTGRRSTRDLFGPSVAPRQLQTFPVFVVVVVFLGSFQGEMPRLLRSYNNLSPIGTGIFMPVYFGTRP